MATSVSDLEEAGLSTDFLDLESFSSYYHSEDACALALFKVKWPNGFRCSSCGCPHYSEITGRRLPLYQCSSCHKQNSLTVDTVMEKSRTPLRIWFQAFYLLSQPDGLNAKQLAAKISVTYKTSWLITHKIRNAMSHVGSEQALTGNVFVTHAVYCRHIDPTQDGWHKEEQPLFIGASVNEDQELTHVRIEQVDKQTNPNKYKAPDPAPFILKNVAPEAVELATVLGRPQRDQALYLKRICYDTCSWLAELFQGIGPKHLQAYLDQYTYMWNHGNLQWFKCDSPFTYKHGEPAEISHNRKPKNSEHMFNTLLRDCIVTPVITYFALTRTANKRSSRPTRSTVSQAIAV